MSRSRKRRARRNKRHTDPNADLFESSDEEDRKTTLTPDSNWKELQYQAYLRSRMRGGRHKHDVRFVDSNDRPVSLAERIVRFRLQTQQSPQKMDSKVSLDKQGDDHKLQDLLQQYIQLRQSEDALSSNLLSEINIVRTNLQDDEIESNFSASKGRISQSISLGESATDFNLKFRNNGNTTVNKDTGETDRNAISENTQNKQKEKTENEMKLHLHDTADDARDDRRNSRATNTSKPLEDNHQDMKNGDKNIQVHPLNEEENSDVIHGVSCEDKTTTNEVLSTEMNRAGCLGTAIPPDEDEIQTTMNGLGINPSGTLENDGEISLSEHDEAIDLYHEDPGEMNADEEIVKNVGVVKTPASVDARIPDTVGESQEQNPSDKEDDNATKEPRGPHVISDDHGNYYEDHKQISHDSGDLVTDESIEPSIKDLSQKKDDESHTDRFDRMREMVDIPSNIDSTENEFIPDKEVLEYSMMEENRSKTFIINSNGSSSEHTHTTEFEDAVDSTSMKTAGAGAEVCQMKLQNEETIDADDKSKCMKKEDCDSSDLNDMYAYDKNYIHEPDTFPNQTVSVSTISKVSKPYFSEQTSIQFSLQTGEDVFEVKGPGPGKYHVDSDSDDQDVFYNYTESIHSTVSGCANVFHKSHRSCHENNGFHLPLIEQGRNVIKRNFARNQNRNLTKCDRPSCIGTLKGDVRNSEQIGQRKAHNLPTLCNGGNVKTDVLVPTNPHMIYNNRKIPNVSLHESKDISFDRGNRIANIYQELRESNGSYNERAQRDACSCYLKTGMEWGYIMSMPHDLKQNRYRNHKGRFHFIHNPHHLMKRLPVKKESLQNPPVLRPNEFIYLRDVSFSHFSYIPTGDDAARNYLSPLSESSKELVGSSGKKRAHGRKRKNKGQIGLLHQMTQSKGTIGYTVLPALKSRRNFQIKREPDG